MLRMIVSPDGTENSFELDYDGIIFWLSCHHCESQNKSSFMFRRGYTCGGCGKYIDLSKYTIQTSYAGRIILSEPLSREWYETTHQ